MHSLILTQSKSTPTVLLDKETGTLIISGKSLPEDAIKFYQPIIDWLNLYFQDPNKTTILVFELELFNSASSKIFLYIFKLLYKAFYAGNDVKVEWRYVADDVDTLEAGIDYSTLVQLPFTFTALQYS